MTASAVMRVLLVLSLLLASSARADVIPPGGLPAPPTCPPGTQLDRPLRGHGWICTETARCTTDAECQPGAHCEESALCLAFGEPAVAYGACGAADACTVGTCVRASRCVAPPPPPAPPAPPPTAPAPSTTTPTTSGGMCRVSPLGAPSPGALAVLALALAIRRVRARSAA